MSKTWGELKNETLKKMFSYSNNGTVNATGNEDYIAAMPEAANFAMRDLALNCRPLVRRYSISHIPVANMLGECNFKVVQSVGADISYSADTPKAYYFEVDGPCTVMLEKVEPGATIPIKTVANTAKGAFAAYSGLISIPGTIQIRFVGGNLYNIRNVAMYAAGFASASDIPPYTRSDRYNLKSLIGATFMRLPANAVTVTSDGPHRRNDEFMWEADCTMVVDHYATVQFDILYEAHPTAITGTTPDATVLELPDEALDIVPLYMAGQLFMEDNPSLATGWLNQYADKRSELSEDKPILGRNEWNNESGWW